MSRFSASPITRAARLAMMAAAPVALTACAPTGPVTGSVSGSQIAAATLADAQGASAGTLSVRDRDGSVFLTVSARGITPGAHGFHLHQSGLCDAPDFKSSGGHLNPTGATHGVLSPGGKHLGDLPNLEIGADGTGTITVALPGTPNALRKDMFDADGTAVIIHAGADDYRTDPTGDAGGRIACGIVKAR